MRSWIATLRNRGLLAQWAVLGLAVLGVCAVVAPVAVAIGGWAGLTASATAAGVCLVGAAMALTASRAFARRGNALGGALVGIPLRMGVPLLGAVVLQWFAKPLAEAHLLVYFVVFYPVTLFVETLLSLPQADAFPGRKGVSPDGGS